MAKVKAPTFAKPKGMKTLSAFGKKEATKPLPDLDDGPEWVAATVDPELLRLTNALGDEKLAKRVLKDKTKYPDYSTLELVIRDWLASRNVAFQGQVWVLGGRKLAGGQVLDFVIDQGSSVLVLEAQGNYWHTLDGKVQSDAAQRLALLGITIWGKKVRAVVEVWESRIIVDKPSKRNQTMELALLGVELGQ